MTSFNKTKISLRYWLLGMSNADKSYLKCIEAMEMAAKYHTGVRKDKITPEIEHQYKISHFIRTLTPSLIYPSETITVAMLHDVIEDYGVSFDEINNKFGSRVAISVDRLTKVFRGHKKSDDEYFGGIAEDPIASIGKGGDRIHNLQSMVGVFTPEKQVKYIDEANNKILPAIKIARRNFPEQELAYENIKLMLLSQIQLIEFTLNSSAKE